MINKHAPSPKGSRPYFNSSAPHIHTAMSSLVKQSKTNVTHLSRRNKETSAFHRRPSRSLSSLQLENWSDIYTGPTFCLIVTLCLYTGRERCGATKYYITYYNQWCCLHWNGARQILTVNCCCVSLMTYWHKFQMIFNGRFVASSVDRFSCCGVARHLVYTWYKPSFVPPTFFSVVFYSQISIFLSLLSSANVRHWALSPLEPGSWVNTPLTADWLHVCFGTGPCYVF